jgi:hypothetical protein
MGVSGGGADVRRRFWLGIAAVTLVAVGSVVAAVLVYDNDNDDFHDMQREEAMRAAHQMEAVAGLSVDQLDSAAAFFKAEDDLSKHEFEVYGRSLIQQGALGGTAYIPRVTAAGRNASSGRTGCRSSNGSAPSASTARGLVRTTSRSPTSPPRGTSRKDAAEGSATTSARTRTGRPSWGGPGMPASPSPAR